MWLMLSIWNNLKDWVILSSNTHLKSAWYMPDNVKVDKNINKIIKYTTLMNLTD